MASASVGTGDATPPPQCNPEVGSVPGEQTRYEAMAMSFLFISWITLILGIVFICMATGPSGGFLFYLFLFMGVWYLFNILTISGGNSIRAAAEDAKSTMTLHPVSSIIDQEQKHPFNGLLINGFSTFDSERTPLIPFSLPHKAPVNIPEVLYVQLHRASGTEQPVPNLSYYNDTGSDGPSEKFLRRSLWIICIICWLFIMWVFYINSKWTGKRRVITIIITTLALYWGGWVRLNKWLDGFPLWEGPEEIQNTVTYGATAVSCVHCGEKLENRLDNDAGQVVIEEGETIETIV